MPPKRRPASVSAPSEDRVALSAASLQLTSQVRNDGQKFRRLSQPWQDTVFTYYHTVPECWYAAQYYARSLSMVRVFAARKNDQGEVNELPAGDPASKLLARIQDPGGGTSQLFAAYGRLRFLIGEGFLICTREPGVERWEFLSPRELRVYQDNKTYVRVRAPGLDPEELDELSEDELAKLAEDLQEGPQTSPSKLNRNEAAVWRLWNRDPEYSWWADAPTRAVLDLFEELLLLQLAVRARAKSRLAGAGILLLAQELDFGSPDGADAPEDPQVSPFMARLQKAMVTPIKDPGTAMAVVPLVATIPAEMMENAAKLIKIHDPKETYPEEGLRQECIRRIATGLDMPQEILLGMADVNHWGSWQIDETSYKTHIRPVIQQLCSDLTSSYLRPSAELEEIEGWESLLVGYDAAELVNHPDRGKDAKDLREFGGISLESLREATGFNDSDALDLKSDDGKIWLATQFKDPSLLPEALRPEEATAPEGQLGEPPDEQGPPDTKPQEDEDPQANAEQTAEAVAAAAVAELEENRVAAITAATQFATLRAREVAGSRLRSRVNGDHKDVPNVELAQSLGAETVAGMGLQASGLVQGGTDLYEQVLRSTMDVDADMARRLGELVRAHAAKHLFEDVPALPETLVSYIRRAV